MKRLTFVTKNAHKVADAQKRLPDFEIQAMDPKDIIEAKLRFAHEKNGTPCFVMDSECSGRPWLHLHNDAWILRWLRSS